VGLKTEKHSVKMTEYKADELSRVHIVEGDQKDTVENQRGVP